MKTKATILFIAILMLVSYSCSKSDIEKGIDCIAESVFIKLKHTTDATNVKIVNYEIEYTGTYELKSVKWTFGDGTAQTVTGKTISHTYAAAGTFTVRADVTIAKGKESCTSSPTKTVTVN